MHLRSVTKLVSFLCGLTREVSTAAMSELNLDKCLEAAIEVAKQAGKVKKETKMLNIPLEHNRTL